MRVKNNRKSVTKKYVFVDANDKDVEVEFTWLALSTEQGKRFQECSDDERLDTIMDIMKENLGAPEPYRTALLDYLYSDGNMFEEFAELQDMLGKQKKDD